ncbi:MAG: calcium/sodium antiporter [Oligosphaeraceae bacterium]
MSPLFSILLGVLGLVLLTYGADLLVQGGVRIAETLGIPSVVIGLTLVSFATSAPELVVSIQAALGNAGDISLGNVVGSNICNTALILGVAALITPMTVHRRMLVFDTPVLVVASLLLLAFATLSRGIGRLQALVLLLLFAVYLGKHLRDALKGEEVPMEETPRPEVPLPLWKASALVLLGLAGLVIGSKLFVNGAVVVARLLHVSDAVIGLTIVSVGTSLPELATSAVAAFRKENDIAVGNVVGSNIFNILAILGIAPLIRPIHSAGIHPLDLLVMAGVTILMLAMAYTGKTIRRWEGALLLLCYLGYMGWLVLHPMG